MVWGELFGFWQERDAYRALYGSERTVNLEDLPWSQVDRPKVHYPVLK